MLRRRESTLWTDIELVEYRIKRSLFVGSG